MYILILSLFIFSSSAQTPATPAPTPPPADEIQKAIISFSDQLGAQPVPMPKVRPAALKWSQWLRANAAKKSAESQPKITELALLVSQAMSLSGDASERVNLWSSLMAKGTPTGNYILGLKGAKDSTVVQRIVSDMCSAQNELGLFQGCANLISKVGVSSENWAKFESAISEMVAGKLQNADGSFRKLLAELPKDNGFYPWAELLAAHTRFYMNDTAGAEQMFSSFKSKINMAQLKPLDSTFPVIFEAKILASKVQNDAAWKLFEDQKKKLSQAIVSPSHILVAFNYQGLILALETKNKQKQTEYIASLENQLKSSPKNSFHTFALQVIKDHLKKVDSSASIAKLKSILPEKSLDYSLLMAALKKAS